MLKLNRTESAFDSLHSFDGVINVTSDLKVAVRVVVLLTMVVSSLTKYPPYVSLILLNQRSPRIITPREFIRV